jgi:hypothetical protein
MFNLKLLSTFSTCFAFQVAVIQNSSEHQLAVRKNARADLGNLV